MDSLLSPLFGILNWIICLCESFFYLVADGIIWGVNIIIAGLAAAIVAIIATLPNMPSLPSTPSWSFAASGPTFGDVEGWVAWFWPVGTTVAILAFLFAAWLLWQIVSMVMRLARFVE